MLGRKSAHAKECFEGGFTGTHFDIHEDLSDKLSEAWRPFNAAYVPVYLKIHPDKSKVAAGFACGAMWTVSKGLRPGDVILSPDGAGRYRLGEIEGEYWYAVSKSVSESFLKVLADRTFLSLWEFPSPPILQGRR